MPKSKFEVDQCVRVKKGYYEGELSRIVRICNYTGFIHVIYASWGDPAKQDVVMGPYTKTEVESISCKTFTTARNAAIRDFKKNMGADTPIEEEPPRTPKKPRKTRKRKVHTTPKEGSLSREEVRAAVRAAREKKRQTLENFMG